MPPRPKHMHRNGRHVENFEDRGGQRLATWRLSWGRCARCLDRCPLSWARRGLCVSHMRFTVEAEAGYPWAAAVDCWATP